jgi:ABC-type bacteriocin/lantibiotic exporter with double-glycine peptidase domain
MTVETVEMPGDPGLFALALMLRLHGISAGVEQIRRKSKTLIGIPEMLRCAKEHGLKSRTEVTNWSGLLRTTLPAIAGLRDGGFLIAAKISQDKLLVQHPESPRPEILTRSQFESVWNGRLLEMTRGRSEPQLSHRLIQLSTEFTATWQSKCVTATKRINALLWDTGLRTFQVSKGIITELGRQVQLVRGNLARQFHIDELPADPKTESVKTNSTGVTIQRSLRLS